MKTQKGYILPIVLVIILLVLAGFVVFTKKEVIAPESEESLLATSTSDIVIPVATTTQLLPDEIDTNSSGSTSTDTTEDVSIECTQDEDCTNGAICYFEPGGAVGVCTNL